MLNIPVNEQGWGLFFQLIRNFVRSGSGGKAIGFFTLIIVLLFTVNGLNVLNSFVGRDFMSAIVARDTPGYIREAAIYVGMFAALTVVAVCLRYAEESLGLIWRDWMTRGFVDLYLKYPTYYRINDDVLRSSGIEHPDQRIAEDVKNFTTTTLSFALMMMNGVFTVVAFSGVLWSISPSLFVVAVLYALFGSYLTVVLGKPLVDLNYDQLDKEASFRSGLMHVREHAESVALLHREVPLKSRLSRRFDDVVGNFRKIILVNRRLGFFTTGYNWLVQIIPVLIVAPLFIDGKADFGVVTQSANAFAALIGAFSLIITQFQSISSFAAVIQRLISLWYAIELAQTDTVSGMDIREEGERVAFESLTLRSTIDGRVLVQDLDLSIPRGTSVIISGPDEMAKDALFKATAGIAEGGTGTVIRPGLDQILFMPERTYLPPGSLRDALVPPELLDKVNNDQIFAVLKELRIDSIVHRAGGLDAEQNWDALLSINEQQLISLARILIAKPAFAFLNCPATELGLNKTTEMLGLLTAREITCITIARYGENHIDEASRYYQGRLELLAEGHWRWRDTSASGSGTL